MKSGYKEVYFDKYRQSCTYADNKEDAEPCCECLNDPVNVDSHRPVKWEEAYRPQK